jgi:hypothetical protein
MAVTSQIDPIAGQTPETKTKKHSFSLSKRSVVSIVIMVALVLVLAGVALPVSRITVVVHNFSKSGPYAITVTIFIDGHDKGTWIIQPGDEVAVGTWFVKTGTHTYEFMHHGGDSTGFRIPEGWGSISVPPYFGTTVHLDLN